MVALTVKQRSILFVVNCLEIGGAEIQVVRLAGGLRRRGWRVSVVSLLPEGPLVDTLTEQGVGVRHLNMRSGVPNPLGVMRLRRIIREEKPDIVHSHIVHANVLARFTRLVTPMRVLVCTAHNSQEGGRAHDLSYRYTDLLADLTTNVSQTAVDRYIQIGAAPGDRIRFVPNGLDTDRFQKSPEDRERLRAELNLGDRFAWLSVGRFCPQKDHATMLQAFSAAMMNDIEWVEGPGRGRGPNPVLLLAGTGPLEGELRWLAGRLGIERRVRFLGVRTDIPQLMNAADALVLSSEWEGMPLVLQEASATELPIVATGIGGNAEVVQDGISGLLVPPGDENSLATAMKKMMGLSQFERAAMGFAGREFMVRQYDMERILGEWEGIYEELLNSNAG